MIEEIVIVGVVNTIIQTIDQEIIEIALVKEMIPIIHHQIQEVMLLEEEGMIPGHLPILIHQISWRDNVNTNEATTSYQQPSYQSPQQQQQTIEEQQQPPSPIEIEYNKLVDRTNQLLDSLSNNKADSSSSTTLQLMDFDKVMTDWSKFHLEVDNNTNKNNVDHDDASYNSYSGSTTVSLKTKASNQYMKLLHALEYNYDCLLHHSLPDSSSLQTSEEEELPQTKHTQLIPNAASYNLALHTLAHSDHQHDMAQEAYSILMRMLDRYQKYMDTLDTIDEDMSISIKQLPKPCEPTIITYNSVLHAIAKSGTNDAGHLAEKVFDMMDITCNETSSSSNRIRPNARTLAVLSMHGQMLKVTIHNKCMVRNVPRLY